MPLTLQAALRLDDDGVDLPDEVLRPLTSYRNALSLKPPEIIDNGRRIQEATFAIARTAAINGAKSGVLKSEDLCLDGIEQARRQDQAMRDAHNLIRVTREAAGAVLINAINQHAAKVIEALRDRHAYFVELLSVLGRSLPANISEHKAMMDGGKVGGGWVGVVDLATSLEALRQLVIDLGGGSLRGSDWHSMTHHCLHARSKAVRAAWTRDGRYWGAAMGSTEFYLAMIRAVPIGDIWAPTLPEASALAAQLWPPPNPHNSPAFGYVARR